MWWKKSTQAELRWDPAVLAVLDRVETRLDRLEALVRDAKARQAQVRGPHHSDVREWLPVLDRMHEIALVAMGHPDLAQSFGLTGRQREAAQAEGPTKWEDPERGETDPEGTVYG